MQKAIKEQTGDCSFVTEQEYLTVDDAVHDKNPLTEMKTTVIDLRIDNAKYKLKKDDEPNRQNKADSSTTANNITNS
jgi:hypothetical protein